MRETKAIAGLMADAVLTFLTLGFEALASAMDTAAHGADHIATRLKARRDAACNWVERLW